MNLFFYLTIYLSRKDNFYSLWIWFPPDLYLNLLPECVVVGLCDSGKE